MRKHTMAIFIATVMLLSATLAGAATVKGVTFPDAATIGGRECRLNGVGVRKKVVISVYLGALYLGTPTGDAAAAIAADEPKRIVMHFVHSKVGAEAMREAWREGFAANSAGMLPQLKERLERFSGWFDEELLKGEQIVLTYLPGQGTEVTVQSKMRGVIEGADFMRALWAVWL
ncbi:MAG: chalcone isomerase family protein, partial [Gammaproteobacteria bacterium]|nr:chalcone isomerase family protein [Gammaproteobacteria bacterium]